ncbi:MAG: hypothetical protein AB1631_26335 [Acidobacteriota bacterium]
MNTIIRKSIIAGATALVLCFTIAATGARTTAMPAADINLSAEEQTIASFDNLLNRFDRSGSDLDRKAAVTRIEFNSVKAQADEIKKQIPQMQQAIRSLISRLDSARLFASVEAKLAAAIRNENVKSSIRAQGGLRRILEQSASQSSGLATEIDSLLEGLTRKVSARDGGSDLSLRAVRVAFVQGAGPAGKRFRCTLTLARATIEMATKGELSDRTKENLEKNCNLGTV